MRIIVSIVLGISFMVFSCSPQKRISVSLGGEAASPTSLCDSFTIYKSLYINKINANMEFEGETYNARLSLYYIPDSVFFITAVNSGFEIVRLGISRDSFVYINRLDKLVYIYRDSEMGYPPPILFQDMENLINRQKICDSGKLSMIEENKLIVDNSSQDISKKIYYSSPDLGVVNFEFFQKKTGEYIVGEKKQEGSFVFYSNYLIDDVTLEASGGEIEFDRDVSVDLYVNPDKYEIIHL